MKRYSELLRYSTLEERYAYLRLAGEVGCETFGSRRYMNQGFYASPAWRSVRRFVIVRDNGCDLGVADHPIPRRPVVHHINPITIEQMMNNDPVMVDPENLITTSHDTHNAIHYGDARLLPQPEVERRPGDHIEW